MKSPFKMTPGRGNMPKTGNGISPTLMCGSPTRQEGDPEYTKKHTTAVEKFNKQASTAEGRKTIEKGNQMTIDPTTGKAKENTATHYVKIEGGRANRYDSGNKLVQSVQYREQVGGGDEYNAMKKDVERSNKIKATQSKNNTEFANLTSGNTVPKTEAQKKRLLDVGHIKR